MGGGAWLVGWGRLRRVSSACTHSRRASRPTRTARLLTYDANDKGEQVDGAVKDLDVPLRLVSENSVDQDGWRGEE